jgi:hypothetical protein
MIRVPSSSRRPCLSMGPSRFWRTFLLLEHRDHAHVRVHMERKSLTSRGLDRLFRIGGIAQRRESGQARGGGALGIAGAQP